jgi:hypothetical protein
MRAKPLALAIASLHATKGDYFVSTAPVESQWKPHEKLAVARNRKVTSYRHIVELVRIEGEDFTLRPALTIINGIARRTIHTEDYTHVFSVKANFATGDVVGHLQSFEHGSHEYVYMKGEWAITTIETNEGRRGGSDV